MLDDGAGEAAVRWARRSIGERLGRRSPTGPVAPGPDVFEQPRGVFVTLKRHPDGRLRGCIGYPMPVLPLGRAIADAAVSAAFDDPRFPPVAAAELGRLIVEVSVLTLPVPVEATGAEAIAHAIRVGRDGLIVDAGGHRGLLLPQVAPEQGWSAEEFLDGTCEKAGLPRGAWHKPGVRIRRFEAEIFAETEPEGPVRRVSEEPPAPRARRAPRT